MSKRCVNCGMELEDDEMFCGECGTPQPSVTEEEKQMAEAKSKSRLAAGLLGLFLGSLGLHNFYLGFKAKAILQIVVTALTMGLGCVWGMIEGILILAGKIDIDANGKELQ